MKNSNCILLLVFILFGSSTDLFGQTNIDNKIRRLIEITDTKSSFEVVVDRMIDSQKSNTSLVFSVEYWALFKNMLWDSFQNEGLDQIVILYKETFSEQEIDEILSFYESSIGKKMIKSLPSFLAGAMQIGETIGEDIGEAAIDSLQVIMKERFEFEYSGCEFAKSGTFESKQNGLDFSIVRTIDGQKEVTDTHTNDLDIEWLNDCQYKITLISTTDTKPSINEFPVLIFNILSDSKEGYEYVGKPENVDYYFQGFLVKKN